MKQADSVRYTKMFILVVLWASLGGCIHTNYEDDLEALRKEFAQINQRLAYLEIELQAVESRNSSDEDEDANQTASEASWLEEDYEDQIVLDGIPFIGDENATLTMVEVMDYQCPFCRKHHATTFKEIERHFINSGKLKYYFYNFPLSIHDKAEDAAVAALCAQELGQYWPYHQQLLASDIEPDTALVDIAGSLSIDLDTFSQCLEEDKYANLVRESAMRIRDIGVTGTPTFFLGTLKSGRFHSLVAFRGRRDYREFEQVLSYLSP